VPPNFNTYVTNRWMPMRLQRLYTLKREFAVALITFFERWLLSAEKLENGVRRKPV
jgi:hypothetical protein